MPDFIVPSDSGKMFDEKSIEELEQMLDTGVFETPKPPEEPPAESVPSPAEPEPAPAAEAAPEPEQEPEIDEAKIQAELEAARREKLEAALAAQQAHASRLAGEIGYLKEKLKAVESRPSEPYRPDTEAEIDRLAELERRQAELEATEKARAVAQAVGQSLAITDANTLAELKAELEAVVPKYEEQFQALLAMDNPNLARQAAEAIRRSVLADAKELKWQNRHKEFTEKRAATVPESVKAKRAATVSASGAVPAPPPKPKTYADMSSDELDRLLRDLTQ